VRSISPLLVTERQSCRYPKKIATLSPVIVRRGRGKERKKGKSQATYWESWNERSGAPTIGGINCGGSRGKRGKGKGRQRGHQ